MSFQSIGLDKVEQVCLNNAKASDILVASYIRVALGFLSKDSKGYLIIGRGICQDTRCSMSRSWGHHNI